MSTSTAASGNSLKMRFLDSLFEDETDSPVLEKSKHLGYEEFKKTYFNEEENIAEKSTEASFRSHEAPLNINNTHVGILLSFILIITFFFGLFATLKIFLFLSMFTLVLFGLIIAIKAYSNAHRYRVLDTKIIFLNEASSFLEELKSLFCRNDDSCKESNYKLMAI
jgi:hypothetical protein